MNKLHWLPSQFVDLDLREKAVVIAFIEQRVEDEKKESAKMKAKSGSKKRRKR